MIKERIEENIGIAIEKFMELERELLDEVDAEFGENPFAEFWVVKITQKTMQMRS